MQKLLSFLVIPSLVLISTPFAEASSWVDNDRYYPAPNTYPAQESAAATSRRKASSRQYSRPRDLRPFSPDSNNVSLQVGQTFLMGDLGTYDDALGFSGNYTYGVSRLMAFESSLSYSNHSEGKYSMLSLSGGGRMNLAHYDRITPYVNGGLGFYKPSREIASNASISATLFGLYVGAGADLALTPEMFFGAALSYTNAFGTTKDTSVGPVSLGGAYTTFQARVGYTF